MNLTASGRYAAHYHIGSHYGVFEFGGKIRNGHKYQNSTEDVYDGWKAANYPMTQFLSTFSSNNYLSGNYFGGHFGPVSAFTQIESYTLANLANYLDGYKTAADGYPNVFDIIERISAGYLMNTMEFGKLHVVAGVRFEGTQMNTLGYNETLYPAGSPNCALATGCGVPVPTHNNPSYVDALPSLSAPIRSGHPIRLTPSLRPRRGASRRLSVGPLRHGRRFHQSRHAWRWAIPRSSPNTPITTICSTSVISIPPELLQAGFFAKQLSGTLISTSYAATAGAYQGDLVSQWINVSNAYLYGLEVAYQQRLAMLPGRLEGLGMFANYSWTASQIKAIPGRLDSPTLQRQAPNSWNISPTYDRGRLSVRVGLSYNGPSIYQYEYQTSSDVSGLGPHGPSGDVYTLAHTQLDAQASIRIAHGLSAVVYGLNLTNEVFGYYTGSEIFVNQREWYKPTYTGGLRYTFNREK